MKKIAVFSLGLIFLTLSACFKDLDQKPFIEVTSEKVLLDSENYVKFLAKLYAGLAVTGQQGPSGNADISSKDEGFNQYNRIYFYLQDVPTDVATLRWSDEGVSDMNLTTWTSTNPWIKNMYIRIFYQINLCNEFLRETTDERLRARNVYDKLSPVIKAYRAEARYLRALSYYHALDLYGNVPFVTEKDAIGSTLPKQTNRNDLFNYLETELKDMEGDMLAPRTVNGYGRADKGAAWALLTKLYQNAEVYTGQKKYTESATYAKKVIDAGAYELDKEYRTLFLADNDKSKEIIFSIQSDGQVTKSWGSTTFFVNASIGGDSLKKVSASAYGVSGSGWGGLRTRKEFVNKFSQKDIDGKGDKRAMFFTYGQNLDINTFPGDFKDGYAVQKFKNLKADGTKGSDKVHPDTDYPVFRLADIYLTYAENILRGGTGDKSLALNYVNALRKRANAPEITDKDLTLDFILDERARELYWESCRRQDLIRFGKFTGGSYLWTWKGNVKDGVSTDAHFNLYPIPAADLLSNPNLKQNPGY
jgi:starch-binding outer membrane protein, SusD/RagB family